MTDGPTTMNGPLHTPNVAMDDRLISASFATQSGADSVRNSLIAAGIPAASIAIAAHAAEDGDVAAKLEPADQTLLGKLREAILPEDSERAPREARANNDAVLEVRPTLEQVETVVRIIEAGSPTRFDPALERWRNAG